MQPETTEIFTSQDYVQNMQKGSKYSASKIWNSAPVRGQQYGIVSKKNASHLVSTVESAYIGLSPPAPNHWCYNSN